MAKYNITHKCGHIEVVNLYGSNEERERRIAYLESQECPECRKRAEQERAMSLASELPALEGSEKQIAWAMTIRQRWIDGAKRYFEDRHMNYEESVNTLMAGYKANQAKYDMDPERQAPASDVWRLIIALTETRAAFFINNR